MFGDSKKFENMTLRSVFVQAASDAGENFSKLHNMSLMQKFRRAYRDHEYEAETIRASKYSSGLLYLFLSTTSVYTCLRYAVPFYFGYLGEWPEYYLKVVVVWVFIQVTANWMCVQLYATDYKKTRDRPDLEKCLWEDHPHEDTDNYNVLNNGSNTYASEKKQIPWYFCIVCQLHCPPRCHHCRVCGKCILKRDHHCFMLGTCIGYYNQRYFIVLGFYLAIAGFCGMYLIYQYMKVHFLPTCEYIDLFLPYTIYRFVTFDLEHQYMLMLVHLYFLWFGGCMGTGFFVWQMMLTFLGKTSHEAFTNMKVKVTSTVSQNFRSVFGPFWPLNFIFPAIILFRQPSDGTDWDNVHILYEKK